MQYLILFVGVFIVTNFTTVSAFDHTSPVLWELNSSCQEQKTALSALLHANLTAIKTNWKTFDQSHPELKTFFKLKLSSQDKKAIRQAMVSSKLQIFDAMTSFISTYFNTLDTTLITTTVANTKSYKKALFATLTPYIDSNKIIAYNAYVADFLTQMEINKTLRLTSYAEILKYNKVCAWSHSMHKKIPGLLHALFQSDHNKD